MEAENHVAVILAGNGLLRECAKVTCKKNIYIYIYIAEVGLFFHARSKQPDLSHACTANNLIRFATPLFATKIGQFYLLQMTRPLYSFTAKINKNKQAFQTGSQYRF